MFEALEEPSCDSCDFVYLFDAPSTSKRFEECSHSSIRCSSQPINKNTVWKLLMGAFCHAFTFRFIRTCQRSWIWTTLFERSPCLEEGFFEIPANGHHFTGRLHRSTKCTIGSPEFIKRPSRDFDDNIIQSRFKCSCCSFSSYWIW